MSATPAVRSSPGFGGGTGRGRRSRASAVRSARYYLPAVLVFVGATVAWEVLFTVLNFQSFLLPNPSAIVAALQANWSGGRFPLLPSALATLQEALLGLAIGTVAGVAVAFASARWVTARGILLPLSVAANAVPIIAFAPLLNNWFGLLNPLSKALMAAVLVFFPVMANVTRGLVQVEPGALELMRSYAASEWTILRKVRIPNALPYFFTAMKIATTLSLIGAIVGEYFGGPITALGVTILNASAYTNFSLAWAGIVVASAFGILFYSAVAFAERLTTSWDPSRRAFHGE